MTLGDTLAQPGPFKSITFLESWESSVSELLLVAFAYPSNQKAHWTTQHRFVLSFDIFGPQNRLLIIQRSQPLSALSGRRLMQVSIPPCESSKIYFTSLHQFDRALRWSPCTEHVLLFESVKATVHNKMQCLGRNRSIRILVSQNGGCGSSSWFEAVMHFLSLFKSKKKSKIALRETGLQKHDAYLPFFAASLHAAGASAECVFFEWPWCSSHLLSKRRSTVNWCKLEIDIMSKQTDIQKRTTENRSEYITIWIEVSWCLLHIDMYKITFKC